MKNILVVEDSALVRNFLNDLLAKTGHRVTMASNAEEALEKLQRENYDLILLDVWLHKMNGLELLAKLRAAGKSATAVIMTADDTPETLLTAVREQAFQYIRKPFEPKALLDVVELALAGGAEHLPIEVISARPEWVELVVPSDLHTAERIQVFLDQLKNDLPAEVRDSVGRAFRELLLNAVEWGGRLDPNRKVRIACLRTRRMVLYRIADPGQGFRLEDLPHAAVNNPPEDPLRHHQVREEQGLRAGGFGLLMTRTFVDELLFNEARNEVVFIKYLD
ncbi:MAG: histidine kinase [Acidobacteria bacterium]|nr:MAG: histidine kinase [Acidobacteriota bacterium]